MPCIIVSPTAAIVALASSRTTGPAASAPPVTGDPAGPEASGAGAGTRQAAMAKASHFTAAR